MENKDSLREQLSELEHEQWIAWSKNIAETENITPARLERWKVLWRPYSELTEAEKDQDREWADKSIAAFTREVEEFERKVREKIKQVEDGWEDPRRYGEHKGLTHVLTLLDQLKTKLK